MDRYKKLAVWLFEYMNRMDRASQEERAIIREIRKKMHELGIIKTYLDIEEE